MRSHNRPPRPTHSVRRISRRAVRAVLLVVMLAGMPLTLAAFRLGRIWWLGTDTDQARTMEAPGTERYHLVQPSPVPTQQPRVDSSTGPAPRVEEVRGAAGKFSPADSAFDLSSTADQAANGRAGVYRNTMPTPVNAGDPIPRTVARLVAEGRFVDLHADTILRAARRHQDLLAEYPGAEVDIPKLRRAGVGLTFFAVCSPRPRLRPGFRTWKDFAFIRYFKEVMASHPDLEQAFSATDARRIQAQGRIPVVLSIEGAGILLNDPGRLQTLYEAGVRAIGLVWNITNTLADSARDEPKWGGLSPVGRDAVREMNRLGIMVDVSHASEAAFWDILETSTRPVYASHSNAHALRQHARNLKDEQIRAIAERGGIIGVAFHRTFLKRGRGPATIEDVVAHVQHIARVGGIGCVAIGTDFGGGAILPAGLGDIGKLPALVEALLRAGFSEQEVRAIMGGNAMRYFETICP